MLLGCFDTFTMSCSSEEVVMLLLNVTLTVWITAMIQSDMTLEFWMLRVFQFFVKLAGHTSVFM